MIRDRFPFFSSCFATIWIWLRLSLKDLASGVGLYEFEASPCYYRIWFRSLILYRYKPQNNRVEQVFDKSADTSAWAYSLRLDPGGRLNHQIQSKDVVYWIDENGQHFSPFLSFLDGTSVVSTSGIFSIPQDGLCSSRKNRATKCWGLAQHPTWVIPDLLPPPLRVLKLAHEPLATINGQRNRKLWNK